MSTTDQQRSLDPIEELRAWIAALQTIADAVDALPDSNSQLLALKCELLRRLNRAVDEFALAITEFLPKA